MRLPRAWDTSLAALLTAAALAGCTGVLPGAQQRPVTTYRLQAPGDLDLPSQPAGRAPCPAVTLTPPQPDPGLETRGIAYVERPYQLDYYAYSQWAAPPALMLQSILEQALQAGGLFQAVLPPGAPAPAPLRLDSSLRTLQQVYTSEHSAVRLELSVRIYDQAHNRLLAGRGFSLSEPAPEAGPYGGVVAANRALEKWLGQLRAFLRAQLLDSGVCAEYSRASTNKP